MEDKKRDEFMSWLAKYNERVAFEDKYPTFEFLLDEHRAYITTRDAVLELREKYNKKVQFKEKHPTFEFWYYHVRDNNWVDDEEEKESSELLKHLHENYSDSTVMYFAYDNHLTPDEPYIYFVLFINYSNPRDRALLREVNKHMVEKHIYVHAIVADPDNTSKRPKFRDQTPMVDDKNIQLDFSNWGDYYKTYEGFRAAYSNPNPWARATKPLAMEDRPPRVIYENKKTGTNITFYFDSMELFQKMIVMRTIGQMWDETDTSYERKQNPGTYESEIESQSTHTFNNSQLSNLSYSQNTLTYSEEQTPVWLLIEEGKLGLTSSQVLSESEYKGEDSPSENQEDQGETMIG